FNRFDRHNIAVKAMPNVMGYDAPSAIRILEQQGVNVRIRGAGRVVSQSIPPGAALNKGTVVTLFLKV
ncbi:MAG: PASTA domain-containing protein, partial [Muribaculaceae bacterium]|nr:PASTA domain-containing protein [Muribaculaceae bacterium]